MNKKITFFTFAAVLMAFSFLFVSCPSGLEPSWKNADKPVFTLDFSSSLQGEQGSERALVQGGGFLYIRTIGSPSGSAGKFYGPFRISSGVFSTTEIPAGEYDGLGVIYASTEPKQEKISWNDKAYRFEEFMNLPDAEFKESAFPMEDFFDSDASGNMVENVTIVAGKENTVELTLEPMVSDANWGSFEQSCASLELQNGGSSPKKQFFALENAPSGLLSFEVYAEPTSDPIAEPTSDPIIGKTALYDKKGNLLKSWASGTNTGEFALPNHAQNDRLYFYIEYSGTFYLDFFVEPGGI